MRDAVSASGIPSTTPAVVHDERSTKCCPQHLRALRAERHADADLVRALHDLIANQSIQADTRQSNGQYAERDRQLGDHALLHERAIDHLRSDVRARSPTGERPRSDTAR